MFDKTKRTNTVGSLTSDAVSSMMPPTPGTTQSVIRQPPAPVNNIEVTDGSVQPADSALTYAITRMADQLNEPFVTVNTVSGNHDIQKAQSKLRPTTYTQQGP